MTEQTIETVPTPTPTPTTKPGGSAFSTFAIVAALVSLFLGGYILGAVALGFAIRAKMLAQPRATLALWVSGVALLLNAGFAIFLA